MKSPKNRRRKSVKANFIERSCDASSSIAIKCLCGDVIILVPDLKVMGKAIEAHVDTHRKMKDCSNDPEPKNEKGAESEAEAELIENHLIAEVFKKIIRHNIGDLRH
jgi:hypothetical protein